MRLRILLLTLLAVLSTTAPAAALESDVRIPPPRWNIGQTVEVGGLAVPHIPSALGDPQVFESEGDDGEQISTAVWERPTEEGWEVTGKVGVVRAPWLTEPASSYAWLVEWQDRPEAEAIYRRITLPGGRPAWLATDQIIWQPSAGSIASVTLHENYAESALLRLIARWSEPILDVSHWVTAG